MDLEKAFQMTALNADITIQDDVHFDASMNLRLLERKQVLPASGT
jgi:hypothetical protein